MRARVDYYCSDFYEDHDDLIYELCNTVEERIIASRDEIKKMRNKIREFADESLILDYLCVEESIEELEVDFAKDVKEEFFWEDYFTYDFLIKTDTLMPITEAIAKIAEKKEKGIYGYEYSVLLKRLLKYPSDKKMVIEFEKEIMEIIESEIEGFENDTDFIIEYELLEPYLDYNEPLQSFFNTCDLLILLRRVKKFENILENDLIKIKNKQEDSNEPNSQLTSYCQTRDFKTIQSKALNSKKFSQPSTTMEFLMGSELEKKDLLDFLISNYSGKKSKSIAIMILALKEAKQICYVEGTKLYSALKIDFGDIGTNASIDKQMTDVRLMDKKYLETISLHAERIKKHLEK